jgi:transposase
MERKQYPSDMSDDEWTFVAPYLTLMSEEAPQRDYSLREVAGGLRWLVRSGSSWRLMPHDLPPWYTVYQQTQRWVRAGVFEAIVHDLRHLIRLGAGRDEDPTPSSMMVEQCNPRHKAAGARVTTGIKNAKATKCIWRWILWVICWPCTLLRQAGPRKCYAHFSAR